MTVRAWPQKGLQASLAGALLLATVGAHSPAGSITYLGKPTNTPPPDAALPLSGFHRTPLNIRVHGKPALVFVGTQADGPSGMERWAVVKALDQFGTLSRVTSMVSGLTPPSFVAIATFNWSRAQYRSRYLTFEHADLLNVRNRPYQHLSPAERRLYVRYSRAASTQFPKDPDHAKATLFAPADSTRHLPLVAVGGYVQTVSQDLNPADFAPADSTGKLSPLTFQTIHAGLTSGLAPPNTHLVLDVNAEANVITALICHSTKLRPAGVCRRSAIRAILRHTK